MASRFESIEKEAAIYAEKARLQGYWFKHKTLGLIETPEGFEMLAKLTIISKGPNCRSIVDGYIMFDPKQAILSQIKYLKADIEHHREFAAQVFEYFNFTPKERLK